MRVVRVEILCTYVSTYIRTYVRTYVCFQIPGAYVGSLFTGWPVLGHASDWSAALSEGVDCCCVRSFSAARIYRFLLFGSMWSLYLLPISLLSL